MATFSENEKVNEKVNEVNAPQLLSTSAAANSVPTSSPSTNGAPTSSPSTNGEKTKLPPELPVDHSPTFKSPVISQAAKDAVAAYILKKKRRNRHHRSSGGRPGDRQAGGQAVAKNSTIH